MSRLITDLDEIKRITERDSEGNWDFRSFLKGGLSWGNRKLDDAVHEILADVSSQIDCTACANCCTCMSTEVTQADIKRLAKRLGTTTQDFAERYCEDGEFGARTLSPLPCPFLRDRKCTVYEDRPKDCRDFPHLHKGDIRSRSMAFVENAELCPIVFNVLEELKSILRWRPRR